MSLYDGLDVDTGPKKAKPSGSKGGKPDVSGWSAGIRMMQTHLRMKKAALTEAQRKIRSATLAPVVDLKKSSSIQEEVVLPIPSPPPSLSPPRPQYGGPKPSAMAQPPFIPGAQQPIAADVGNEYDPAVPNEYEKVVKRIRDRKNKERDEERERERESRRRDRDTRRDRDRDRDMNRDMNREMNRDMDRDRPRSPRGFSRRPDSDEEDDERDRRRRVASKAAIAPPTSLIYEDSVVKPDDTFAPPPPPPGNDKKPTTFGELMKGRKSRQHHDQDPERSTTPPPGSRFQDPEEEYGRPSRQPKGFQAPVGLGADSVAAKIMAKYGFKEGSGLGKHEQGLSTALTVEKTSKRGGKIIESKAGNDTDVMQDAMMPPPMPSGPPKAANSGSGLTEVLKNPSKVVLLRNMVGPGEVDDDLQPETAEECSKYGPVSKVIIYEEPGATEDEAVRIFVEFHRIESAIKAVVDLNGRYFGGRVVKGGFYSPAKFSNLELNASS